MANKTRNFVNDASGNSLYIVIQGRVIKVSKEISRGKSIVYRLWDDGEKIKAKSKLEDIAKEYYEYIQDKKDVKFLVYKNTPTIRFLEIRERFKKYWEAKTFEERQKIAESPEEAKLFERLAEKRLALFKSLVEKVEENKTLTKEQQWKEFKRLYDIEYKKNDAKDIEVFEKLAEDDEKEIKFLKDKTGIPIYTSSPVMVKKLTDNKDESVWVSKEHLGR